MKLEGDGVEETYTLKTFVCVREQVCVCMNFRKISVLCLPLCVYVSVRERENETLALLPPTGSCNPLCFGDLGNLVTKHSRYRFD